MQGKCLIASSERAWIVAYAGMMCIPKGETKDSVLGGPLKGAENVLGW